MPVPASYRLAHPRPAGLHKYQPVPQVDAVGAQANPRASGGSSSSARQQSRLRVYGRRNDHGGAEGHKLETAAIQPGVLFVQQRIGGYYAAKRQQPDEIERDPRAALCAPRQPPWPP